jgi:hypothetical protein
VYPGTYQEFLWHKAHPQPDPEPAKERRNGTQKHPGPVARPPRADEGGGRRSKPLGASGAAATTQPSREDRKRTDADVRRRQRANLTRLAEIEALEVRIAETERAIRQLEETMGAAGFYEDRAAAQPVIDRHQALMWEVGELMERWEVLQAASDIATADR